MQTSYEKNKPVRRENIKRVYTAQSKAPKGLQRDKLREAKRNQWG